MIANIPLMSFQASKELKNHVLFTEATTYPRKKWRSCEVDTQIYSAAVVFTLLSQSTARARTEYVESSGQGPKSCTIAVLKVLNDQCMHRIAVTAARSHQQSVTDPI
jgi:hypothetical protein